jgi:hypothetical protein
MLKQYVGLTNLRWVSGLLLMACSGAYVKEVGDITGSGGQGGGVITTHAGSGGAGATTAQAGQGTGGTVSTGGGGTGGGEQGVPPTCEGCTVDVLGPADEVLFAEKHSTVSANIVAVASERVLRKIEATLQITKRTSAAWVVYEEVDGQYVLRVDQATKLDPSDGVFSSEPLEFPLQAGHRYAFGVYLNVGACYENDAPESNELSFGNVVGMSFGGGGDYHETHELVAIFGSQFAMRLFTSAPE